jgi:peptidoglycan/xylan/chitin deacetylase (PgdA/CDA1 family)
MLNYRNTNIGFGLVALVLLLIRLCIARVEWYVPAIFLFDYSLLLFYGSYDIRSNFFLKTFCKQQTAEQVACLTFDDGPCPDITPGVLDLLREYQVKATFFCIGRNIPGNELLLQRMHAEGHIVANHSYAHDFWFDLRAAKAMEEDLSKTALLIKEAINKEPLYFRPPYGVTTPNLAKAVKRLNYTAVGWNIRTYDTVSSAPEDVIPRIEKHLTPGSILLFHDRMPQTVQLLRASLGYLKEKGYRVVSLDELIPAKPYA